MFQYIELKFVREIVCAAKPSVAHPFATDVDR